MDMGLSKFPELAKDRGGLAFCSPWGHRESDMTEQLNWTEEPLMKVKEESEIFGLKLNIQKTKIIASGPITS